MTKPYAEMTSSRSEWLDDLPSHWRVGRLVHVADTWPSNVDKHTIEGHPPVRLCNYTDVYKNAAITADLDFMRASAPYDQIERFRLRLGDVLLTKDSETADDIGIPAIVEYEAPDLVCGYHLSIVRTRPEAAIPKFIFWALSAQPTMNQWAVLASGVTRVGIRAGDLAKATLPLPPVAEQQTIADYLDRETARIDALIEEQQRLVEMLRERRVAAIDTAVWHGLAPTAEVPSGIEPAPTAPVDWRRARNRDLLREVLSLSDSGEGEALSVSHLTGVTPRSEKTVTMEAATLEGSREVEAGDLVINTMWAWMGALGVSNLDGLVSPAYGVYRALPGAEFHPAYFDHLYRSTPYVAEMTRFSRGIHSSRLRLYPEVFLRLGVVVPPFDEQRRIAAHLDEQTARIDTLIAETERFIELSRERRSALITAAVTGQIDVRDEVA